MRETQGRVSAMSVPLTLFGIVVMAVLPPLGLLCIIGAIVAQSIKGYQRRGRIRRAGYEQAVRDERERILAFKALR